jgi:5-formyltetrahydrofolate cyclo-ligase
MVVTGAPAVSEDGYYFGRGVGYLYLEWGLLSELGLVNAETPVVAVVHDCQVVPKSALKRTHDCILDTIITPTQVFTREETDSKPSGINWSKLPAGVSALPYFSELVDTRSTILV